MTKFTVTPDFWRGKRVFVTGHTGFKGGWLVQWLSDLGAICRGFALAPETKPAMFELLKAHELCEHVIGDVRDAGAVSEALTSFRPDIVIHMAAQPLVRRSYREPAATFAANVMGTVNVLEACRRAETLGAVVVVTTDKCYVNNEWDYGYREADALGGKDPYSASKACTEIVTHAYRQSFFADESPIARVLPTASGRAGNVFGGGDYSEDRLIPDAIRAFSAGEPLVLRSPDAVRPWQHCLEPLSGYLELARACYEGGAAFAKAYNFGPAPDQLLTVRDIADALRAEWGDGAEWRHEPGEAHLKEAKLLLLDPGLAQRELSWSPQIAFTDAIRATG
ncbi:MAG: CDP-glucose 4,6-dehydratase, partial [Pseudomonadota bacterium]